MQIEVATKDHLEQIVPLFDAYRVFYEQPSDLAASRAFIAERLERGDSHILLAREAGKAVGFTQLYASLSSVSMRKIWILNDLFVAPGGRRLQAGRPCVAGATGADPRRGPPARRPARQHPPLRRRPASQQRPALGRPRYR